MTAARFFVFAVLPFLSGACLAAEDLSAEKKADIERLLDMTGATAISKQMATLVVTQMSQAIKRARPDIPERIIDTLPAEIDIVFDENVTSFRELVTLLYHKYFTASEVKEMIQFYSTDLGKKTIRVMPALAAESMSIGQRWGQSLGPVIEQRIKARFMREGIKL